MSEQYYKIRDLDKAGGGTWYEPVDIGWRWCKDELPETEGVYLTLLDNGNICFQAFSGSWYGVNNDLVIQWCKLMPPLTEDDK